MNQSNIQIFVFSLLSLILLWVNRTEPTSGNTGVSSLDHHKVYELRTYTTYDDKLDDLHERFADHTMTLFEKHGMENIDILRRWIKRIRSSTLLLMRVVKRRKIAGMLLSMILFGRKHMKHHAKMVHL